MLPGAGVNASFSHQSAVAGDLAFLSQSGALITAIVDWARARAIGFSQIVSLGDMADVDFGDMLDYLAGDVHSRAILLYMESVTNARKFMSAARRAARSKPVIVVKAGRSVTGAKAALSHTGALAGTDAAYEAAFRRAGILRVRELAELFSAAEILARHPPLCGERLAILTNGGGAGVLAADHLGDLGGTLADLSDPVRSTLDRVLPATWSHGNPIDIIGDADPGRYAAALDIVLGSDDADAVLVMNCPTALASSTDVAAAVTEAVERHRNTGRTKAVITSWLGEEASRDARTLFAQKGFASFATPGDAIDGFMHLVRHARAQDELMRSPATLPHGFSVDAGAAAAIIDAAIAAGRAILSEVEAKQLLQAYGIPTVPTSVARNPEEVGALASKYIADHGACVVKILSDDITHKSDAGGVRLGLERAAEAQQAADDMLRRIARERPGANIQGFTVQPMIRRPRAHELILGMSVDDAFGPLLMFGAGGTAVEVMRDTAHALPPLELNLAIDLMKQTRVWRLLQGFRDIPAANIDAVAESLVRLSSLVTHHPQIREIDINPLLADASGVLALDARVTIDVGKAPRIAMAVRGYPEEWSRDIDAGRAGPVHIRAIRPEDEGLYQDFFARVSLHDQRLRFFTAAPHLSRRFLAQLTQIDYAREMAFVAIARTDGALLGVVRMVADPDYTRAEYAILVRSDLKGSGLGWQLMTHLITYAKSEKLAHLYGTVLADNTTMLNMCRELGFDVRPDPDDAGIRIVRLALQ
jgi:acetyltransferase